MRCRPPSSSAVIWNVLACGLILPWHAPSTANYSGTCHRACCPASKRACQSSPGRHPTCADEWKVYIRPRRQLLHCRGGSRRRSAVSACKLRQRPRAHQGLHTWPMSLMRPLPCRELVRFPQSARTGNTSAHGIVGDDARILVTVLSADHTSPCHGTLRSAPRQKRIRPLTPSQGDALFSQRRRRSPPAP